MLLDVIHPNTASQYSVALEYKFQYRQSKTSPDVPFLLGLVVVHSSFRHTVSGENYLTNDHSAYAL